MQQRMVWRETSPRKYKFMQDGSPAETTDRSVVEAIMVDVPDLELEIIPPTYQRVMVLS